MGSNFDTAMLIYRHWANIVYSEKFLNIKALSKCEDQYTNKSAAGMLHTPPLDIFNAKENLPALTFSCKVGRKTVKKCQR